MLFNSNNVSISYYFWQFMMTMQMIIPRHAIFNVNKILLDDEQLYSTLIVSQNNSITTKSKIDPTTHSSYTNLLAIAV